MRASRAGVAARRRGRLRRLLFLPLLGFAAPCDGLGTDLTAATPECAILDPREANAWKDYEADEERRWQFSYKIRVPKW